ncbi:double-stranded DNA 3'-5' exodeoxyribonuclease [Aureococcus anophagefferens]|nr:double-stranded DNA 3'-5' exodeoxyribonuclease [Aureococcus anophagefferens]
MEGVDDERSAVSSDLGDASEDEELGALGDFRPSALGLSPPPGRLFKSASSAASSSPTLSLPESFDNLGSVASGPGGAPRAPGNYLEPATRARRAEAARAAADAADARRESEKSERAARVDLEALEHRSRQRERSLELELESTKKDLDAALARVARSRDDVEAGLRTAAKLADCEIAKKRLEARLSFLEEQHGKSLDAGAERDAAAFKIENGALKEQVRAYETLELELDSAVLRCADGTRGVDANGHVLASPELRDALAAGLSRPERRVRHAVLLAQKLLRTEAELRESLQGEDGARAAAAPRTPR